LAKALSFDLHSSYDDDRLHAPTTFVITIGSIKQAAGCAISAALHCIDALDATLPQEDMIGILAQHN